MNADERRTEIEGREMQRRGGVGTPVMSAKCLPGRGVGVAETPRPAEGRLWRVWWPFREVRGRTGCV